MRAVGLMSMVAAFVLICAGPSSGARAASPEKPSAPQPLTGANGTDAHGDKPAAGRSAPKGQAVTKADAKGRVNALSPEEKHRAARARERAAAKAAPPKEQGKAEAKTSAPVQSSPTQPLPAPTSQRAAAPLRQPAAKTASRPVAKRIGEASGRRAHISARQRWTPRVGAVVPRGVPLYPLPRGYRPGPVYAMRPPWQYVPRSYFAPYPRVGLAFPPFPRSRGYFDDDED